MYLVNVLARPFPMSKAYWLRSRVSDASMEEMARHEREKYNNDK